MSRETTPQAEAAGVAPFTPWDKSWMIRMGALDLRHGHGDTLNFLSDQEQGSLSDDLVALREASEAWAGDGPVHVRESGTLYRVLLFLAWKFGLDKEFVTSGTLSKRQITLDPSIVNLSQTKLLELDNGTSQWASAAALSGDPERLDTDRPKLKLTYEAIDHWEAQRARGMTWEPRRDATISRQAETYIKLLADDTTLFEAEHAEDFCFAVAMGYLSLEEGAERWPNLRGHETNRVEEMPRAMEQARHGQPVDSPDHRVVQAIAMLGRLVDREVSFEHPDAVNKSWPQFWPFLDSVTH